MENKNCIKNCNIIKSAVDSLNDSQNLTNKNKSNEYF